MDNIEQRVKKIVAEQLGVAEAEITASPGAVRHFDRTSPVADTVATIVSLEDHRTAVEPPESASTIACICSVRFGRPRPIAGGRTTTERTGPPLGSGSSVTSRMSDGVASRMLFSIICVKTASNCFAASFSPCCGFAPACARITDIVRAFQLRQLGSI